MKKKKIRKCTRNVILIFGYLLIVAILFVPYKYTSHKIKETEYKGTEYKGKKLYDWKKKTGYVFLPIYFKLKSNELDLNWIVEDYYLRINSFITEIALIILIGGFAYILFCVVLRKDERGKYEK